jgi:hypothetical protein
MFSHRYLYFVIVVGLACLDELRTTQGSASLSEGPSMPGWSKEVDQMKRNTLVLQDHNANNLTFISCVN